MSRPARTIGMYCSLATVGIGALAIVGLAFNSVTLSGVFSHAVAMKPVTALFFLIHGSSLYFCLRTERPASAAMVLGISATVTFIIGAALAYSVGISEQLQSLDPAASICPSGATVTAFLLAGIAEVFLARGAQPFWPRSLGALVGLIGLSTLTGYALNTPALYFFWHGRCTAVAANTGAGFALLAGSLLALAHASSLRRQSAAASRL